MSIVKTGAYEELIGGVSRRLVLRNGEIERFEIQYAPFGIFTLFDQLIGRGDPPQVRHVRDLLALALVGGGMSDREADDLIAGLPPSENIALRGTAQRLIGITFMPSAVDGRKKKEAGSRQPASGPVMDATAPPPASGTSAA